MSAQYKDVYNSWKQDPEGFWGEAAKAVDWFKPADKVFDADLDVYGRWFAGAECNTCYNAVDRHADGERGDQDAIIYDSPITGSNAKFTYRDVKAQVQALAAVLQDQGVEKGDRVVIYMPMIPQAAFAMLACARIGAIHSVVFGGFAANELATRLNDAKPKAIISASCGIEPGRVIAYKPLLDEAIELAEHKPTSCIVFQREQLSCDLIEGRDVDYSAGVAAAIDAGREVPCVPVAATDPLYVLYTSGTTGQPKGVVRDNGGHMVALSWSMKNLYDIQPGEVFWAASDVGWVVGHSYIVYAPLVHGATTVLFEGKPVGTPDAGTFWRVINEHNVVSLFTAPTAFRAIKKEDPNGEFIGKYDLSKLRTLFLAGERADPDTVQWAEDMLKVPVIDHWWQTETGWAIAANPVGIELLPVIHGSPTVAMPGYDVQIVGSDGHQVAAGDMGNIVIKLPMAPGNLPGLWQNDERFRSSYLEEFPGYYQTGDAGYMDENGYLYIMSRTDDIINVAGHRLSTGAMEEVLSAHPDVAECAVIGIADKLKGQLPAGFVVLKSGVDRTPAEIEKELVRLVREKIGPVAAFKIAVTVDRLPKTRSGKILRGTMRKIADNEEYKMPATIDDPAILDEIGEALKEHGL
ncbi:propionyl-CoA synthetase [Cohaesibacter gelatinilyticus]|uniref:Propionyl-CoA synthetase n=1 Tax=Cohaesibacter gelatinilyticus TaxID=372072 RepID=A0A285PCI8_9HYPH|nr:propionyl-CoA synthetase [Cohaesibacter gelatinilyticus]SNZ18947.1 propionyl-CoA synthetase [Cohaesibacter gelatinilyticus]